MYNFLTLGQADLDNKRVLLRVDFNVPIENGQVSDTTRIERVIPTIKYLLQKNATVVVASHLGRPQGQAEAKFSLEPVAQALAKLLGQSVSLIKGITTPIKADNNVYMLENLRFHAGEEQNCDDFAQRLSKCGDIYVNDGFAISHRAHASVCAITKYLPSYAGLLMEQELHSLTSALTTPTKPLIAIVGGSKVSTKLGVLKNLIKKVDYLIPAGGIANTFLLEMGANIGLSLAEPSLIKDVALIKQVAAQYHCQIILPIDVMVAKSLDNNQAQLKTLAEIADDDKIFDIGPQTVNYYNSIISQCKTLVWNGPLGVFEVPPFDDGTTMVGQFIAQLCTKGDLFAVIGGGETIAALNKKGLLDKMSYASTAGGAFLEWLEGIELPGIKALCDSQYESKK